MWRQRKVAREANSCGKPAVGLAHEVSSCNADVPCNGDRDCTFGNWHDWSGCTEPCHGIQKRTRNVNQTSRGKGAHCSGALAQVGPCNPRQGEKDPVACGGGSRAQDCKMTAWTMWEMCSATCGIGQTVRRREIELPAKFGGKFCEPAIRETKECNKGNCPSTCISTDCAYSDWGEWSACDKCGGEKRRFRHILRQPKCMGKPCELKSTEQWAACPRKCHALSYCAWASWGDWNECSRSCGAGVRDRQRLLTIFNKRSEAPTYPQANNEVTALAALHELEKHTEEMESRRLKEIVVSFVCGLAAFFVIGAAIQRIRSGTLTRLTSADTTNVAVE